MLTTPVQVPVRYHACGEEQVSIESRLRNPTTPEDHELIAVWTAGCDVTGMTPASQTLTSIATLALRHLGISSEQAKVFLLTHTLLVSVSRNVHTWQSNLILIGPPGAGKSAALENVTDCLPSTMVRPVDNASRCAHLVPDPNDDAVCQVIDELVMTPGTPADKEKQAELNAMLARGFIMALRAGMCPLTNKLIRHMTIISNRSVTISASNDAIMKHKSAFRDRSLVMFIGTSGGAPQSGPSMVARKSTVSALAKRKPFIIAMQYLQILAVEYWSIEAAGGLTINTENGAILQSIYDAKNCRTVTSPRTYNYIERIAINLMVIEVVSVWYKHGYGALYNYSKAMYVYFCRVHSTVGVHHFVQAAAMVRQATLTDGEQEAVLTGLKLCATMTGSTIVTDGAYIVLNCRPAGMVRAIEKHVPGMGEGVTQEVAGGLYTMHDNGMPILDEHEVPGLPARLKLLISSVAGILTPGEKTIVMELRRLVREDPMRWRFRWEADDDHTRAYVFKPSVREAILDPMARPGAYSPASVIAVAAQVYTQAMAFLDLLGPAHWAVAETPVFVFENGGKKIIANRPLVVSAWLLEVAGMKEEESEEIGLEFGGRLAPGTALYDGVGRPPIRCPELGNGEVRVKNFRYAPPKLGRMEAAADMVSGGEMDAWRVAAPEPAAPMTAEHDTTLFSRDQETVTLRPSEGGFEMENSAQHTLKTNGRAAPPEWIHLERLTV